MKKILYFIILSLSLSLFGCPDFLNPVKNDLKVLDEFIQKSKLLNFSAGDTVESVKQNFTVILNSAENADIKLSWSTSNENVFSILGDKVTVKRKNEEAQANLILVLRKNRAEKRLAWTLTIPKMPFTVPNSIDSLLTFKTGENKDGVVSDFNYTETLDAVLYPGVDATWTVSDDRVFNLTSGTASIKNISRRSQYKILFSVKFTSPAYPNDHSTDNILITVPAVIPTGSEITQTFEIEGRTLKLTYFDEFDNQTYFEQDWDIGNPGYGAGGDVNGKDYYAQYRTDSGNAGIAKATLVQFADGLKGYDGDRYKQPYWSPKATKLNGGNLELHVFWDPDISGNPTGKVPGSNLINSTQGYGLSGAIHSKRQFPCGLFITKVKHKTGKRTCHWDAWWAESNNPFSRQYGSKTLFMPPGGQDRPRRGKVFTDAQVAAEHRGLNGEQLYEFDMYEWVYSNGTQWQVLHSWSWYGGYPGNEDRADSGDTQLWSTADNLRSSENNLRLFSQEYQDGGLAASGDWFYLAMLVTPDKIQMWNSKDKNLTNLAAIVHTESGVKTIGFMGNSSLPSIWNANEYAPIQVKYSSELGDWGNKHNLIYNMKDQVTKANPDIMYSDYFAFYAWDEDRGSWYGGRTSIGE